MKIIVFAAIPLFTILAASGSATAQTGQGIDNAHAQRQLSRAMQNRANPVRDRSQAAKRATQKRQQARLKARSQQMRREPASGTRY
ncbi:hypothetical protein T281_04755 [Rhodomicrobium udaipurense JA643]|uniref:Uncharacterized protein n=1 Tax=Rhodomicrobium udaipurense TaxID=1202716 RepID=A0A8I1GEF9_9HYPH|nr:hypothetical protein [Rhodomicrobium udaipurense]KAI95588.1 hypothetical protein T281_04755 [Rhodomicrobium udaipurense JA643]MBJ7542121.1 hypothetical protein [Rhodomicrobium udaipurense]